MKKVWWFIIFALIIQEPTTTDAAIFQARSLGLDLLIFNLIWLISTIVDILIGYKIGTWTQNKFKEKIFLKKVSHWAEKIEEFIGRQGENFAIICLGIINFSICKCIHRFLAQTDFTQKTLHTYFYRRYYILDYCLVHKYRSTYVYLKYINSTVYCCWFRTYICYFFKSSFEKDFK